MSVLRLANSFGRAAVIIKGIPYPKTRSIHSQGGLQMQNRHLWKSWRTLACIFAFSIWQSAFGQLTLKSDDTVQVHLGGFGSIQAGQIVQGHYASQTAGTGVELQHLWLEKGFVNLTADVTYHNHLRMLLGVEGKVWRDEAYSNYQEMWEVPEKMYSFYIPQAECRYILDDMGPLSLQVSGGIFPYKYNPDVRNLGEYLFRTGTYPGWIINEFDKPYATLTGFRANATLWGTFSNDILLTTETDIRPIYDFSLSYIGKCLMFNMLELGWGIDFANLISVNENETSPHTSNNIDAINGADTVYYSFAGVKPMVRLSFDPKPLLPFANIFGKEDLRIYAEAAVLGLQSYKILYTDMGQRTPVMIGFNIPAFKIFDVLSLQTEWYDSPYPNSYTGIADGGPPIPDPIPNDIMNSDPNTYKKDSWKWSLYAKKTIAGHFSIIGQMARDHIFTEQSFSDTRDRQETLIKNADWWWVLKLAYNL